MRDHQGVYSSTIDEIVKLTVEKKIKWAPNATIFIDGCNTANSAVAKYMEGPEGITIAEEMAMKIGVPIIAATGSMAMVDPKKADGKFKIQGGGKFVKITRVVVTKEREIVNPDKSWWEFWKPDKVTEEYKVFELRYENLGTTISVDDYADKTK